MTHPPKSCMRIGCSAAAAFGLKLGIPAAGVPMHRARPLEVVVGVLLCPAHAEEATPADYLTAPLRKACTTMSVRAGSGLPDFDRALIRALPLDGVEWAMFERRQQQAPLS